MDFCDPREAAAIVLRLREAFHMTDDRFGRLHHFFHREPERMESFLAYCRRTARFQAGGSNETTSRRLAACLERLDSGDSWAIAERLALERFPLRRR